MRAYVVDLLCGRDPVKPPHDRVATSSRGTPATLVQRYRVASASPDDAILTVLSAPSARGLRYDYATCETERSVP